MPDGTHTPARDTFLTLGDNGINLPLLVAQLRTSVGVTPFIGAGMSVPFGLPDWRSFLLRLAPDDVTRASIDRRLARGEYEEAAQDLIDLRGRNSFQDVLEVTFGEHAAITPAPDAAAHLIPALASGPVFTTNFDFILERVFTAAGRPFDRVVNGMRVDDLRKVVHERRHALVHLHGTAGDRTDRVLTLNEYNERYRTDAPLEALVQLVATQPMLFLGCSLDQDRPVRALRAYAEQLRARNADALLAHFAVLEYPADEGRRAARIADLAAIGVRPIWFPTGQYGLIRELLAHLVNERTRSARDAQIAPYTQTLLSSFRLDGAGLAIDGASAHAQALAQAYRGAQYTVGNDTLTLDRLIDQRRRLVLLGEPGSGKSVTLKRALTLLHDRVGLVPVYLRLADFAITQTGGDEIPAAQFFQAFADRAAALGVPACDAIFFETLVRQGRAAIALDGFDEIGSRSQRERVAAAIGRLSEVTAGGRLLVASRPGEFRATPLPYPTDARIDPFAEGEALPFGSTQLRGFLRDCFGDDGTLWRTIEGDDRLRKLATTPLLITLLALLAERGPLPDGHAAIFVAIVDTAITSWEGGKGGAVDASASRHTSTAVRHAFEELALAMHQRENPASPLAEGDALRVIGNDSALLERMVNRTGLLHRIEQRGARTSRVMVQGAHLQLQEFLAGAALARRLIQRDPAVDVMLADWATRESWWQPMEFAAAELVRRDELALLERWLTALLHAIPPGEDRGNAALLCGQLLAEADADFLPATALELEIVLALQSIGKRFFDSSIAPVLAKLAPRPASMRIIRDVALQNRGGSRWLAVDDLATIYQSEAISQVYAAGGLCTEMLCRFGEREDAQTAIDFAIEHARTLPDPVSWVSLAPHVRSLKGEPSMQAYLRDLLFRNWLITGSPFPSIEPFLNTVARVAGGALARTLAFEGLQGNPLTADTASFATWLEGFDDASASAACDAYYTRLREAIAVTPDDLRWHFHRMTLWPARDSVATDALRRAVLANRDLAWFVMRDASLDERYATEWRAAWIDIVLHDTDDSRRRSLIHEIAQPPRRPDAAELLLLALGADPPLGRVGSYIIRALVAIGEGDRLITRLVELHAASQDSQAQRESVEFLQRLAEKEVAERNPTIGAT
jgi:hypothetical protein